MTRRGSSTLRDMLRVVFRHGGTILVTTACTLAVTLLYLGLRSPAYQSHAQVVVGSGSEPGAAVPLNVHAELQILEATRLDENDLTGSGLIGRVGETFGSGNGTAEQTLRALHRNLRIEVVDSAPVIRAGFIATDPQLAADLSNLFVARYLERRAEVHEQPRLRRFFDERIVQQGTLLDSFESELSEIWTADEIADLDLQKELLLREVSELERRRRDTENLRERIIDARRSVTERLGRRGGWIETPQLAANAPELATLDRLHFELRAERARFAEAYLGDARPLRRFDRQLAELRAQKGHRLVAILDARERGAKRRIGNLREDRDAKQAELASLNGRTFDLLRLERERSFAESTYVLYRQKALDLRLQHDLLASGLDGVTLIRPAVANHASISPNPLLVLALAGLIGLVLGSLQAIAREKLDHTFLEPERVTNELSLPVLAAVPDARDEARAVASA